RARADPAAEPPRPVAPQGLGARRGALPRREQRAGARADRAPALPLRLPGDPSALRVSGGRVRIAVSLRRGARTPRPSASGPRRSMNRTESILAFLLPAALCAGLSACSDDGDGGGP